MSYTPEPIILSECEFSKLGAEILEYCTCTTYFWQDSRQDIQWQFRYDGTIRKLEKASNGETYYLSEVYKKGEE